jgi:hypothetical protein
MGLMVGDTGHVLGIERYPSLAKRSETNLRRALPDLAEKGTVQLEVTATLVDMPEHVWQLAGAWLVDSAIEKLGLTSGTGWQCPGSSGIG